MSASKYSMTDFKLPQNQYRYDENSAIMGQVNSESQIKTARYD
jgi:hypothetical protein